MGDAYNTPDSMFGRVPRMEDSAALYVLMRAQADYEEALEALESVREVYPDKPEPPRP